MKKIIIFFGLSIFICILIYKYTMDTLIDILVLGDSISTGDTSYGSSGVNYNLFLKEYLSTKKLRNYDMTYTKNNLTIKELNYQLKENNEINNKHIQNRIKEAEIIIISLGQDELAIKTFNNNLNNSARKDFYEDYKELLKSLRKITNKKIFILGIFGPKINELKEIEQNLHTISKNYSCTYIKLSEKINEKDYFDSEKTHLNYNGHKKISRLIINNLNL